MVACAFLSSCSPCTPLGPPLGHVAPHSFGADPRDLDSSRKRGTSPGRLRDPVGSDHRTPADLELWDTSAHVSGVPLLRARPRQVLAHSVVLQEDLRSRPPLVLIPELARCPRLS